MMKMKNGQLCAACVNYADTNGYSWIIARYERRNHSGKIIVRDEFCENPEFERYSIETNQIIPFPINDEVYSAGDPVLALWYDSETKEWSTMFYGAVVVEVKSGTILTIKYKGSNILVDLDKSKVSKYPEGFEIIAEEEDLLEEETSVSKSEDLENENSKTLSAAKMNEPTKSNQKESKKRAETPQEERRLNFLLDRPVQAREQTDYRPLSDDDFSRLAGNLPPHNRMHVKKGTPLIDFLQDPDIFPKSSPHVTGNGVLRIKQVEEEIQSELVKNPDVKCGRLSKLFHQWRV